MGSSDGSGEHPLGGRHGEWREGCMLQCRWKDRGQKTGVGYRVLPGREDAVRASEGCVSHREEGSALQANEQQEGHP